METPTRKRMIADVSEDPSPAPKKKTLSAWDNSHDDESPPTQKHIAARVSGGSLPTLCIELIVRISRYASTAGRAEKNDLQNILVALGPKEVGILRHTYLYKNMGYLSRCLNMYLCRLCPAYAHNLTFKQKMKSNILTWMEVNADNWKKLCTKENVKNYAVVVTFHKVLITDDPLVIFNNPAVAIYFGLAKVLKYLVEEMHIAIDAGKWNHYGDIRKTHLISMAMRARSMECFEYLLTIEGVDIYSDKDYGRGIGKESVVIAAARCANIGSDYLAALIRHKSFNQNPTSILHNGHLPLTAAVFALSSRPTIRPSKTLVLEKVKVLLEAGADPGFIDGGFINDSPISAARRLLRRLRGSEKESEKSSICKEAIALMEENIERRAALRAMARVYKDLHRS